jgi:hypothetical protein
LKRDFRIFFVCDERGFFLETENYLFIDKQMRYGKDLLIGRNVGINVVGDRPGEYTGDPRKFKGCYCI